MRQKKRRDVHTLGRDENNDCFLVDHRLIVLIPIRMLGVAARHIDLAQHHAHLLGVHVAVVVKRSLPFHRHPLAPVLLDN